MACRASFSLSFLTCTMGAGTSLPRLWEVWAWSQASFIHRSLAEAVDVGHWSRAVIGVLQSGFLFVFVFSNIFY